MRTYLDSKEGDGVPYVTLSNEKERRERMDCPRTDRRSQYVGRLGERTFQIYERVVTGLGGIVENKTYY